MGWQKLVRRGGKGAWAGACLSCSSSTSVHPEAAEQWPSFGYRNPPAFPLYGGRLWNPGLSDLPSQPVSQLQSVEAFGVFWFWNCSAPSSPFVLSDPPAPPRPLSLLRLGTCFARSVPSSILPSLCGEPSELAVAAERLGVSHFVANFLLPGNLVLKVEAYCWLLAIDGNLPAVTAQLLWSLRSVTT